MLKLISAMSTIFSVIVIDWLAEQPFEAVTVTVYIPALFTNRLDKEPTIEVPLDQLYVPPPVALSVIVGVVQVIIVVIGGTIETSGYATFCVIVCEAVAVHPFEPVTVKV